MTQKPRKKREKLSPKLKSESVPFRRSASTRGPLDIWHATHQKKLSCKQISILDPGASPRSPGLEQELLQNNSSGSEPSPRGAGGTRPRNLAAGGRAGGRGAGEGSGGGAAPLRPASERVSERAGVRALRGPVGGRAAAEDAEGRRRGPDSAGAAGRAPPEGVGRPRGRARAEPRALRSVRWLAPSLARSLAPSFRGGGSTRRRRRRPGSRHGGRPEPGVDLLAAALLDVRDHQGRPGLLHQVSGRAGGGGGAGRLRGGGSERARGPRGSPLTPLSACLFFPLQRGGQEHHLAAPGHRRGRGHRAPAAEHR